jgi:oligopeptide transport system substrate-binding protein
MKARALFGPAFSSALVLLCALAFAGCWQRETNVQRGDREQILHRGVGPDLADLDPQLAVGLTDYNVLSALFEGLVAEDPIDLHPVPGVAESWEISPDGLTYTFYLRASAKWSDGQPVVAQDFVDSYKRILSPSFGAENAAALFVLRNAEAYHGNAVKDFSQVGVHALDTRRLELRLEHPAPAFLSMLNQMAFMPVPLRTIEKFGAADKPGNTWARPHRLVSDGPFVLEQWKIGQKLTVLKSPTYWDAANVKLKEIEFYFIESQEAEERAFRAGQIHLTEALPISKVDSYRQHDPQLLRIDPFSATEFFRINVSRPFLDDTRVRQALNLAIDRKAIAQNILRGGQQPAYGLIPPDLREGAATPVLARFDPNEARALLSDAGYPKGQGAPVIELLFNSSETHRAVAEAVQEMWRRELGLTVHLLTQENKMILSARQRGEFQVLRSVWAADYLDPLSFLAIFTSENGNNFTRWQNGQYDAFVFEAARTADAKARRKLIEQAETLLIKDAPILPLYYYTHVFAIQPSVKNWHPTLLDHHPYKAVYLDSK